MARRFWIGAVTLLSLGVLSAHPAGAQKPSSSFGPMGGLALGNLHGADVEAFVGVGTQSRTAFAAGAFATFGIAKNFAIEPQVLYVSKGAKASASGVTAAIKLNYVEVPLLLKAVFPLEGSTRIALNLFAGPAIAFRTTCNIKASGGGVTLEQTCSDAGLPVKSTDFMLAFGGGMDVGPVALQVRYDLGLSKLGDVSQAADIKTNAWLFTGGFRIPIRGR